MGCPSASAGPCRAVRSTSTVIFIGMLFIVYLGFSRMQISDAVLFWAGLAVPSKRLAQARTDHCAVHNSSLLPALEVPSAVSTLPVFFVPLGRWPVPVDVTGLYTVGEVEREAVNALSLSAKLGHAVTAAEVRIFVISHEEALQLMAGVLLSKAEKGAPLGALDAFDARALCEGSCLLVELEKDAAAQTSTELPAAQSSSNAPPAAPSSSAEPPAAPSSSNAPQHSLSPVPPEVMLKPLVMTIVPITGNLSLMDINIGGCFSGITTPSYTDSSAVLLNVSYRTGAVLSAANGHILVTESAQLFSQSTAFVFLPLPHAHHNQLQHFLFDAAHGLYGFWHFRNDFPMTLVIPDGTSPTVKSLIEIFAKGTSVLYFSDVLSVSFRNVIVPPCTSGINAINFQPEVLGSNSPLASAVWTVISSLRSSLLLLQYDTQDMVEKFPCSVFSVRTAISSNRVLVNRKEFEAAVHWNLQFALWNPMHFTFRERAASLAATKLFLVEMGSDVINVLFLPPGSKVLLLCSPNGDLKKTHWTHHFFEVFVTMLGFDFQEIPILSYVYGYPGERILVPPATLIRLGPTATVLTTQVVEVEPNQVLSVYNETVSLPYFQTVRIDVIWGELPRYVEFTVAYSYNISGLLIVGRDSRHICGLTWQHDQRQSAAGKA